MWFPPSISVMIVALMIGATASVDSTAIRPSVTAMPSQSEPPAVTRDVPYTLPVDCGASTCEVELDIYRPAGSGPFPTVVLVRGGPSGLGGRTSLDPFATALAASGVIVYSADMRDLAADGGGYPAAFEDIACAVRFARASSTTIGGDGSGVILVGHSFGGYVGSVVALNPDEFEDTNCLATGSGRPDAFVGLAGNYDLQAPEVSGDFRAFFGATEASGDDVSLASNPFSYADGTPIPVRLVAGSLDRTVNPAASSDLNAFLALRQWNTTLTVVPGAGHGDLVDVSEAGSTSIAVVWSAADALWGATPVADTGAMARL